MSEAFVVVLARKYFRRNSPEIPWTIGIVILLISPVTVIGNGLVLASILYDPFKNIRSSPSSNLIFSLALADLLVGILTAPLMAIWHIYIAINNSQPFSTTIISFTGAVSVGVSLYSLVALSLDRRIAIATPLQYAYRVTKKKIRIVNICIWCYFIIFGILAAVSEAFNSIFDIIAAIHSVIASIILVFLNIAVVRSVRNQASIIKKTVDSENLVVLQNAFNREKAVTQTIGIMVVVFQICFWPFVIILCIANTMRDVTHLYDIKIIVWVYFVSISLMFANSLMNPFLYAWRLPKYRKVLQHFLIQFVNRIFVSEVQHHGNKSRLSTTEENQNTPASLSLPSLAHHESTIASSTTEQTICRSAFDSNLQEHIYSTVGHTTENTWL